MAATFINHASAHSISGAACTSSPVDMSNSQLLVMVVGSYAGNPAGVTDSTGVNNWLGLTALTFGSSGQGRIHYAKNPTVSSTQTFSTVGAFTYGAFSALGFNGMDLTSPFDSENGQSFTSSTGTGAVCASGNLSPGSAGCVVIYGLCGSWIAPMSVNISDTGIVDSEPGIASNTYGAGSAYQIQTTATPINPTFTWTASSDYAHALGAVFKSVTGGGIILQQVIQHNMVSAQRAATY